MDEQFRDIKFRGGWLSALVLAVSFGAVLLTRFAPSFLPDYTGLGAPPRLAVEALGCIDWQASAVLRELHREAHASPAFGEEAAREFLLARKRGLELSYNVDALRKCADKLQEASPYLARRADIANVAEAIAGDVIDVYSSRASILSIEFRGTPSPDGGIVFTDMEAGKRHEAERRAIAHAWERVERRIATLSSWIGETVSRAM